jgi:Ser/Thr protein kinase RdoA (MazF antagonist)
MKEALLFVAMVVMSGCAVTYNLVPVGWNRYQAEVSWAGGGEPTDQAKDAATKKCASLGETLGQLTIVAGHDDPPGHATLIFECR